HPDIQPEPILHLITTIHNPCRFEQKETREEQNFLRKIKDISDMTLPLRFCTPISCLPEFCIYDTNLPEWIVSARSETFFRLYLHSFLCPIPPGPNTFHFRSDSKNQ